MITSNKEKEEDGSKITNYDNNLHFPQQPFQHDRYQRRLYLTQRRRRPS